MKNDIIAIRLTDSWITNAQIIALLKADLAKFGVEVIENARISVNAQQSIPREQIDQVNFPVFEFVKKDIAKGIAEELFNSKLIRFFKDEDGPLVRITGTLDVLKTKNQKEMIQWANK